MSGFATELDTLTREDTTTGTGHKTRPAEPGDADRFAHYVEKEALGRAFFEGTTVQALCGKQWTPVRDPSRFPVCPECRETWETFRDDSNDAEGGE